MLNPAGWTINVGQGGNVIIGGDGSLSVNGKPGGQIAMADPAGSVDDSPTGASLYRHANGEVLAARDQQPDASGISRRQRRLRDGRDGLDAQHDAQLRRVDEGGAGDRHQSKSGHPGLHTTGIRAQTQEMLQAMSTAATGMQAQETQIQVISNNLANASTPGFKVSRAHFRTCSMSTSARPARSPRRPASCRPDRRLDSAPRPRRSIRSSPRASSTTPAIRSIVAIQGNGFFQVSMPDGSIAYTRDGSFRLDQNGRLVTLDGYAVIPASMCRRARTT